MTLVLNGTNGLSDVDGSAATPAIRGTDANTGIFFPAADTIAFSEGGAESMRIDSSGNVGIGTSSPAAKLSFGTGAGFKGLYMYDDGAGASGFGITSNTLNIYSGGTTIAFGNSQSSGTSTLTNERMRIDGSGNLLVGTTAAFVTMPANLQGSSSSGQLGLRNSGATAGKYWTLGPNPANNIVLYNQSGVGVYIVDGGTSWTGSSDERLKTDLQPIENAAQKVNTLRAVTGRFKTDDEGVSRAFLIAQDVQAVLPEAVNQLDDEIGTLGLQYTDVIPLLVAAVKEQQALITTLTDRITALEAKP